MPKFRAIISCVLIWGFFLSLTLAAAIVWGIFTATEDVPTNMVAKTGDAGRLLYLPRADVESDDDTADFQLIRMAVSLGSFIVWTVVSTITAYIYWSMYIKPEPNKYIPQRAIIPADLQGRFTYDLCDCCGAGAGLPCCFLWCPACAVADLWYRSGLLHAVIGGEFSSSSYDQKCPGWYFFGGACGWCLLQDTGCLPCVMGLLRGGFPGSDGDMGSITPHRKRFGIPGNDINSFCMDCCIWCWCGICAGVQEYRQVMDALNRGPLQVAQPPGTIVGMPVAVGGGVAVGTVVAAAPVNKVQA